MKGLKVLSMVLAIVTVAGVICEMAYAETRTLTTTLIVTIRPKVPEAPNAPQQVQDLLASALTQSQHDRYVKLDLPSQDAVNGQRYTLMERL